MCAGSETGPMSFPVERRDIDPFVLKDFLTTGLSEPNSPEQAAFFQALILNFFSAASVGVRPVFDLDGFVSAVVKKIDQVQFCDQQIAESLLLLLSYLSPKEILNTAMHNSFDSFKLVRKILAHSPSAAHECVAYDDDGDVLGVSTPLHDALEFRPPFLHDAALDAAKALIEAGANVNALDYAERRPLDVAILSGNLKGVELLICHRVEITESSMALARGWVEKSPGGYSLVSNFDSRGDCVLDYPGILQALEQAQVDSTAFSVASVFAGGSALAVAAPSASSMAETQTADISGDPVNF